VGGLPNSASTQRKARAAKADTDGCCIAARSTGDAANNARAIL
jgi:hypothetical protein